MQEGATECVCALSGTGKSKILEAHAVAMSSHRVGRRTCYGGFLEGLSFSAKLRTRKDY